MARGKGIRFLGGAFLLTVLLLIAAGLMVGSKVSEGLEQMAKSAPTKAAATPPSAAGPDPAPAAEAEQEPSKHCTADACVYVASTPGKTPPSPGEGYSSVPCGLSMVAHKSDQPFQCNIATMSHAIAAVCAKGTKGGKWCEMSDAQKDAWIPLPQNINASSLADTAAPTA
jgi:hypothetical protein